jgi:hypothetical protein
MKKIYSILFFTIFIFPAINAQQLCKRTSVFFDLDKTDFTVATTKKLDSIVSAIGNSEFLIELYGHTDSAASNDYNLKLAANRMHVVKEYITSKSKSKLQFKEKNLGETNILISGSKEENLAFNRRVDIYLIPIKDGKLVLNGSRNENVETPLDYFEPCGVCNSAPVVNAYYNKEEGAKANIVFQTTEGIPLTTFGTINLDCILCKESKKQQNDTTTCVYRIYAPDLVACTTVWDADTINGKIYWKPSKIKLQRDSIESCYVFRGQCGGSGRMPRNLDCPDSAEYFNRMEKGCYIILPKEFPYKHISIVDQNNIQHYYSDRDTAGINRKDSALMIIGFAKMNDHYYHLNAPVDSFPYTFHKIQQASWDIWVLETKEYRIAKNQFQEFTFSDTLVKIKGKKKLHATQFGYYLKDYNEFIPLSQISGKYETGNKLNADYQYGYIRGKKLYVIENKNVKEKYVQKQNAVQIKFNKKSRKNFKLVKDYKVEKK